MFSNRHDVEKMTFGMMKFDIRECLGQFKAAFQKDAEVNGGEYMIMNDREYYAHFLGIYLEIKDHVFEIINVAKDCDFGVLMNQQWLRQFFDQRSSEEYNDFAEIQNILQQEEKLSVLRHVRYIQTLERMTIYIEHCFQIIEKIDYQCEAITTNLENIDMMMN